MTLEDPAAGRLCRVWWPAGGISGDPRAAYALLGCRQDWATHTDLRVRRIVPLDGSVNHESLIGHVNPPALLRRPDLLCVRLAARRGLPVPLTPAGFGACEVLLCEAGLEAEGGEAGGAAAAAARRERTAALLRLVGAALGCTLILHSGAVSRHVAAAASAYAELARRYLRWFMTANPAGVKLHADICELLGALCLWYLDAAHALAARLPLGALPYAAGLCALLGGLRPGLLVCAAALRALSLPVAAAYALAAACFRLQLLAVRRMWLVMRCRRPLPTLQRLLQERRAARRGSPAPTAWAPAAALTPSGVQHTISGGLIFMALLLLLPTSAWLYATWLALHLELAAPAGLLAAAARLAAAAAGVPPQAQPPARGHAAVPATCPVVATALAPEACSAKAPTELRRAAAGVTYVRLRPARSRLWAGRLLASLAPGGASGLLRALASGLAAAAAGRPVALWLSAANARRALDAVVAPVLAVA